MAEQQRNVEEILKQMTREEKLQQLTQLTGVIFDYKDEKQAIAGKDEAGVTDKDSNGIGSSLYVHNTNMVRNIQKKHMEADRNKIPMLFMVDIVHGYKTIYPIPLGMGATFDPELMEVKDKDKDKDKDKEKKTK